MQGQDARSGWSQLSRSVNALVDNLENGGASFVSLLQSLSQNIGWDAVKLGIELQSGDELRGTSDLEVHITEGIFSTLNIGEDLEHLLAVDLAGHQAHGDTSNRSPQRHASVEQSQSGSADRAHGSRAVGAHGFRDLADGVWELFLARDHWYECTLGEVAVAHFATLRRAQAARLTSGEWWHVVLVDVALGVGAGECVHFLAHLEHAQGGDTHNLGFSALEEGRTVNARNYVNLSGEGADILQATAVNALTLFEHATADDGALQSLEGVAQLAVLLFVAHIFEFRGEGLGNLLLDFAHALLALDLVSDNKCWVEVSCSELFHALVEFVGVFREELELLGWLCSLLLEFVDGVAQGADEWLSGLDTLSNDLLVWLDAVAVVDEAPSVLASASFDHGDCHVVGWGDAAGHDELEGGLFTLRPAWEGDPLAVDQSQAQTTDWAFEWQAGDGGGCGCCVQSEHIVGVIRVDCQHGSGDLNLVTKSVWEQRTQWAINHAACQNCLCRWATLATEERAWNTTSCIHLLLNINRQREEIVVFLGSVTCHSGGQDHRIFIKIGCNGTISLLGETTRLEAQRALAELTIINNGFYCRDIGTLHGFLLCST